MSEVDWVNWSSVLDTTRNPFLAHTTVAGSTETASTDLHDTTSLSNPSWLSSNQESQPSRSSTTIPPSSATNEPSISETSLSTSSTTSNNHGIQTSDTLKQHNLLDTLLPALLIAFSMICIITWLLYRRYFKTKRCTKRRDDRRPDNIITPFLFQNQLERGGNEKNNNASVSQQVMMSNTNIHPRQQVDVFSHVAVDGSIDEKTGAKDKNVHFVAPAPIIDGEQTNPSQARDREVTRILMQQVTTIQRLEAEIQQIRAEGRLSPHYDSSDLPEYGSPRDLTNRVVDVPPNYGEAGDIHQ